MFRTVFPSIIRIQDCTYSNRYMSNRYEMELQFHLVPTSKQVAVSDIYLLLYVQS